MVYTRCRIIWLHLSSLACKFQEVLKKTRLEIIFPARFVMSSPILYLTILNSVLRLAALPSSVLLSATGNLIP